MRVPKFWQKASRSTQTPAGEPWELSAWGWSDESEQAAALSAQERLKAQASALAAGTPPGHYYPAGERPLREELLDHPREGTVITRNAYGARILKTERAAFVDVDVDLAPPSAQLGFFARLFGARSDREQTLEETVELLRAALGPERVSARVYETHSGLRLLLTDRVYEPTARETLALLERLGCDPLYLTLCRQQECFRARLTPKPWRCSQESPPNAWPQFESPSRRWPYSSPEAERVAQDWVERYERVCRNYSATRYLTTLGERHVHDEVRPVMDLHDELSGATSSLPLA